MKTFLMLLSVNLYMSAVSQPQSKGSIGISIPVLWNNSVATYYRLGSPKYPSGNAISYGINISYSHPIYKGFYVKAGLGYFKQNFKIVRPFNYNAPGQLLYSTQSYRYNNLQLLFGMGYLLRLNKTIAINGCLTYNYFWSFNQKYIISEVNKVWQINRKSLPLGEMVNLDLGIDKDVTRTISLGLYLTAPLYVHWKNDGIFINSYYSKDEQQIARNKSSRGITVSFKYYF